MKNTSKNRQMFSFCIDPIIKAEFIKLTKEKSINKSNLLSTYIKKWNEENKDKNT